MDELTQLFDEAQQWLFEHLLQPLLFKFGMASMIEDAYAGSMWLLVGILEIVLLVVVIGSLQRWRPVEQVTDRQQIRVDILYTLIYRLGLFRVALFFLVQPFWDTFFGQAHVWGLSPLHIDQVWPGVTDQPWVSLVIYLLIFDAVDYLYHRAQHRFDWFWALHSVHHSQRQMTMWSDNRNHLLDSVLRDAVLVVVSQLIGVAPAQFVLIVVFTQLVESFSHANVRLSFGRWGDRLLVSPRFHRHHHSIAIEDSTAGVRRGSNFSVLFPVWDILCGTGRFETPYGPTGIHDQLPQAGARDYGRGFLAQQWLGLKRLVGADKRGGGRPVT